MPRIGATQFIRLRMRGGSGSYILLPVLTSTQRNALSAVAGYTIYNSTTTQIENYNGSAWVAVGKVYGDATFLPLAGGTMSGNIAMAGAQTVDGVDISAHAADLDAHTFNWMRKIRTGEYFCPFPQYAGAASAVSADVLWLCPFWVARALTLDRLAIEVTTGAAGKVARLGIYADGTNLYPGALVKDAGTVSVADAAIVAAVISKALTKGLYWLAFVSDGGPTIRLHLLTWSPLGQEATTFAEGRQNAGWSKAGVGAGALADPCVSGASLRNYSSVPLVMPRLLSLD